MLKVENIAWVKLKPRKTPPSDDQLWYRIDDQPNGSFAIVSMSNGRALKRDPESSQLLLCKASEEGDQWMMEGNDIVLKTPSTLMYMYLCDRAGLVAPQSVTSQWKTREPTQRFARKQRPVVHQKTPESHYNYTIHTLKYTFMSLMRMPVGLGSHTSSPFSCSNAIAGFLDRASAFKF